MKDSSVILEIPPATTIAYGVIELFIKPSGQFGKYKDCLMWRTVQLWTELSVGQWFLCFLVCEGGDDCLSCEMLLFWFGNAFLLVGINHKIRVTWVSGDCRSSGSSSSSKQGKHLKFDLSSEWGQAACVLVYSSVDCLHRQRFHHPPGQTVLLSDHHHGGLLFLPFFWCLSLAFCSIIIQKSLALSSLPASAG